MELNFTLTPVDNHRKAMIMSALRNAGFFRLAYTQKISFCANILYKLYHRSPCRCYLLELENGHFNIILSTSQVDSLSLEQLTSYLESIIDAYIFNVPTTDYLFPGL